MQCSDLLLASVRHKVDSLNAYCIQHLFPSSAVIGYKVTAYKFQHFIAFYKPCHIYSTLTQYSSLKSFGAYYHCT